MSTLPVCIIMTMSSSSRLRGMVNKMKLGRDESEVKSNVGKSGGLRYAFFVHQKSKHVLSNVCTSSLFFHNNVNDAARSEEKLGLVIESSRQQPPQNVQCREKKRRWMVLGIRRVHQNKGKRKSKNSKQKKSRNHLSSSSEPFPTSLLFLEVGWKIVVFSLGDGRSGRCFPRSRRPCIGVRA